MRFLEGSRKHLRVFISHCAGDADEAQLCENLLREAGFSVARAGEVPSSSDEKIRNCHFFVLVVSELSLNSPQVQSELGLAVSLQQQSEGFKPLIVPFYALRGLDGRADPPADGAAALISLLTPSIIVTREDFPDTRTFVNTGVFDLYERMFPASERDPPEDIIRWVLETDIGEECSVTLAGGKESSYRLDSRYFILCAAGRAIGLGFFTYDYSYRLIYCNYIGVQKHWRGGNAAVALFSGITSILEELFLDYQGMVLEVEPFSKDRVEAIVADLETSKSGTIAESDQAEIRKFLRVSWYYKQDFVFFFDADAGEPLVCTSPSLDPKAAREEWPDAEEDYWIMWRGRSGQTLAPSAAKALWSQAVSSIYLEILAKSLITSSPENGEDYWNYAAAIIDRTLGKADLKQIHFARLHGGDDTLLARWRALGINLPI